MLQFTSATLRKTLSKLICLSALVAAAVAPIAAKADSINIAGLDTFTSTSVTFNPTTGIVLSSTGFPGIVSGQSANLGSIANFSTASGIVLFSTASGVNTLSFTLTGPVSVAMYSPSFLNISGTGNFAITGGGYTTTAGTFNLTSTNNVVTSFTIASSTSSVTPEPSSLVLLGTGLVGAAGALMRRRGMLTL